MISSISLKQKILISIFLTGSLFLALGLGYIFWLENSFEKTAMQNRSEQMRLLLAERLKSKAEFGDGVAFAIARNRIVNNEFLYNQRKVVLEQVQYILDQYKEQTNYRGLRVQFHTADGHSWLRTWSPDKYGDDISFRPSIQKMIKDQKPFSTLSEAGRFGFAIRNLVPLFDNAGKYAGSLELLSGVGSIGRTYQKEGGRYLLLFDHARLPTDSALINNNRFGNYVLANNKWFNEEAQNFARNVDLIKLKKEKRLFSGDWYVTYLPLLDDKGNQIGMHVIGEPSRILHEEVAQATRPVWLFVGLICLLIVGMGACIALVIQQSVVKPIAKSVSALQNEKDLTILLDDSRGDELGRFFYAFNRHTSMLNKVIGEVHKTAADLSDSTQRIQEHSRQSMANARQQQSETDSAASASEQMAASSREMADHANSTLEVSENARVETEAGQSVVISTISAIEKLASEMNSMLSVIVRLDEGSKNIGQVIRTISEVAEQTNLLALNAAIEAARAGDHGRGFAVVADEVRLLASRTQEATVEINKIIEEVQSAANDVSGAIESGAQQAQSCVEQAQQAGQSLEQINSGVRQAFESSSLITTAANEQSHVANQISESINRISNAAGENTSAMQETEKVIEALASRAAQLNELVSQFKLE